MISVKRVYEVLKDLANKEQRGFISPSEFNTMAPIAQTAVFNKMWQSVVPAEQVRKAGMDPQRGMSAAADIREQLSMYMKSDTLSIDTATLKYDYPKDLYKVISAKTYGNVLLGVVTSVPIEILYDSHRIDYMLQSTLSAPSIKKPVLLVADKMEVYPKSIRKIDLRYYKTPEGLTANGTQTPSQPQYNYTTVSGDEVFDSATSVNFELPEEMEDRLVIEMAGMIGTALREAALINYGNQPQ